MSEFFTYTKKRKEFGKHPYFNESKAEVFGYFPTKEIGWQYEAMNPNFIDLDNIPEYSEHIVNTERISTTDKGMYHREGGWPAGIDPSEMTETMRFKKKIEKETSYTESVNKLTKKIETAILQNNQIDMFEEYFDNEQCEHFVEQISAKTLMLFKDQNSPVRRTVSDISWYPETSSTKIAVGYSIQRFQQAPPNMPVQSYIWDMSKPNVPDITLNPTSSVSSISFNQKLSNIVGMGCSNGLIQISDILKSGEAVLSSSADKSHSAPVTKLCWLSAKSGTELITTSTDGKVFWWDTRKLSQGPVDSLNIVETYMDGDKRVERQIGGTAIEYLVDAGPNKFLVGTEQGSVITASKRANKPIEIIQRYGSEGEYHLGPVYQVHRSPPNYRFFMTVGDWSAKIWNEDLKTPIIRTKYHGAFLSDGCFSPIRPGLFFLIRKDGWLDIWDYYYRQNELAFSHKVSEVPLSCIKLNFIQNSFILLVLVLLAIGYPNGKYVCIGDQDGTVTMMELCESLYNLQPNEKEIMAEMFDRETKKEKALEQKHKAEELKKQSQQKDKKVVKVDLDAKKKTLIETTTKEFWGTINADKKYYEEQLNLKLDQFASKSEYQQEEGQQQEQQLQEEEPQNISQQEPSFHQEEEQQKNIQSDQQEAIQQEEPEIVQQQDEAYQPEQQQQQEEEEQEPEQQQAVGDGQPVQEAEQQPVDQSQANQIEQPSVQEQEAAQEQQEQQQS